MNKKSYSFLVFLFAASIIADFVSCSPVQFTKQQLAAQNTGPNLIGPVSCTGSGCTQHHQDTTSSPNPQANILFILDTSGSCTDIMQNLGSYLNNFIQTLSGIDYRVGLITTDTSNLVSDDVDNAPSSVNFNGALQDGNLVQMSDGESYLTPQSANAQNLLGSIPQIVQAADTCLASGYNASECLSNDPRAIFAANLTVLSNKSSFIRAGVPTTFVIISDADERNSQSLAQFGYPQDPDDAPSSLISNFQSSFPSTPFQVDALVIRPGDTACYNQRDNRNGDPLLFGFYAPIYASLVQQTGGVLGSICNSNFTNQIGTVNSGVAAGQQVTTLTFACAPLNGQYTLQFTNATTGAAVTAIPSTPDLSNQQIDLSTPLPPNVDAVLSYDCQV